MKQIKMDPKPQKLSILRIDQGVLEVDCDQTWLEYLKAIDYDKAGILQPKSTTIVSIGTSTQLRPPRETDLSN